MKEKERAPKKEKPTKRDKEILKKSEAERRENRKSKGITAIITIVVVLLLIGISTVVGLVVKDTPEGGSSDSQINETHNWVWRWKLLENYDNAVKYLSDQGYVQGTDFQAEYDASVAEENDGLIGTIKMTDERGFFEVYYFGKTESVQVEHRNANAYFEKFINKRKKDDSDLKGECHGSICYVYKGDVFDNGVFK